MSDQTTATAATDTQKTIVNVKQKERGNITPEYVGELRAENKERREEASLLAKQLEETSKKMKDNEEMALKAINQVKLIQEKADQQMIRAELKVIANRYGLRDFDDIKIADLSGVKVDENGEVHGVEQVITSLKEKKPYLFESVNTSRAEGSRPSPQAQGNTNPHAEVAEKVGAMSARELKEHTRKWLQSLS